MSKVSNMSKVKDFKENFWKREIDRVLVTIINDGFNCRVELYSFNKSFIGRRIVPSYQIVDELISLGSKNLEILEGE